MLPKVASGVNADREDESAGPPRLSDLTFPAFPLFAKLHIWRQPTSFSLFPLFFLASWRLGGSTGSL
jgi:hypothetical protein